jgi:predicted secreted protein
MDKESSRFTDSPASGSRSCISEQDAHHTVQFQYDLHQARKQDVELYIRTYNTMLRSSGEIKVKALVQAHVGADSSLHVNAAAPEPDMSALMYCVQRLPNAIMHVRHILLGQSAAVFHRAGYRVEEWESVHAPGRRRHWFFDQQDTMAVYVNSASDVDDLVPTLTGFQIEWNKLHLLLNEEPSTIELIKAGQTAASPLYREMVKVIQSRLRMSHEDWARLESVWGDQIWDHLLTIAERELSLTLRMLGGSYVGYAKATNRWWAPIGTHLHELHLEHRPVYFVSSNTHSLINLLSGQVGLLRPRIEQFIGPSGDPELIHEYDLLRRGETRANMQNFFYYAMRKYHARHPETETERAERLAAEHERGIFQVASRVGLPIDTQIIELSKLHPEDFDPRLPQVNADLLRQSRAVIINIDYPLGLAAYHIFLQIAESLEEFRGVYILGKAATLNGRIGDVMIADSVFDEHSQNTYWLNNCFTAADLQPYLIYGSVLDNQKAVTVKGTYLQNRQYLEFYYRENYTVVEMEAGPYLDALYESTYPTRHPSGEHINFTRLPFDLGILHYASDTPYTRGKNLGAASLAYLGMDSAYATVVAMARRIFTMELAQMAREQERSRPHREMPDGAAPAPPSEPSLPPANGNGGNGALQPAAGRETGPEARRHHRRSDR